MPYEDAQEVTGGEKWTVALEDAGTRLTLDVRIVKGNLDTDPTPADAFQSLVNLLDSAYPLYAARQSYIQYRCTPETPEVP